MSTSAELSADSDLEQEEVPVWCFCRCEEDGEMIGCDNELCKIEWFHTDCLRIEKIPKGKWFCPECTKGKRTKKGN